MQTKMAFGYELAIATRMPSGMKTSLSRVMTKITLCAEEGFQPLRDVERHIFFRNTLAGNATAVMAAVAGVDHDDRGIIVILSSR